MSPKPRGIHSTEHRLGVTRDILSRVNSSLDRMIAGGGLTPEELRLLDDEVQALIPRVESAITGSQRLWMQICLKDIPLDSGKISRGDLEAAKLAKWFVTASQMTLRGQLKEERKR
ncbi:MAG: hypothetical protein ACYDFT_00250 [Thermoplasmata archaeon]